MPPMETIIKARNKKALEKGEDLQGSNALPLRNGSAPLREEKREVYAHLHALIERSLKSFKQFASPFLNLFLPIHTPCHTL